MSVHLIAKASTEASALAGASAATEENQPVSSALNAEQDVIAVDGHEPSMSRTKIPVKVEDVRAWKAGLQLSAAATSVMGLSIKGLAGMENQVDHDDQ
jgi:insulysin